MGRGPLMWSGKIGQWRGRLAGEGVRQAGERGPPTVIWNVGWKAIGRSTARRYPTWGRDKQSVDQQWNLGRRCKKAIGRLSAHRTFNA